MELSISLLGVSALVNPAISRIGPRGDSPVGGDFPGKLLSVRTPNTTFIESAWIMARYSQIQCITGGIKCPRPRG